MKAKIRSEIWENPEKVRETLNDVSTLLIIYAIVDMGIDVISKLYLMMIFHGILGILGYLMKISYMKYKRKEEWKQETAKEQKSGKGSKDQA